MAANQHAEGATDTTPRPSGLPLAAMLAGMGISLLGNALTAIAVPWFVLQTTGSATRTGLAAFAATAPIAVAGVFGGPLVDRLGERRASILADLASGVTVALIPLLHATVGLAFWQLLLLVFLGSLLDSPGFSARLALLPDLARMAGMPLERANGASQSLQSLSRLAGPLLAGFLIVALGPSNALWLDAASFAISAALVAVAVPARRRVPAARTPGGYGAELRAGFDFIIRRRLIASMIVFFAVVNFLQAPVFAVLLPVYADEVYGSAVPLGVMLAGFGGGALAGALIYSGVGPRLPRRPIFITAFIISAVPFAVLAFTPPLLLATAALASIGLAAGPLNPIALTVLQERTSEGMRGRVMGLVMAVSTIAMPLGMLASGFVLEALGLTRTLALIAVATFLVSLTLLVNPSLREMDEPPPELSAELP
jgi:MFS family permease